MPDAAKGHSYRVDEPIMVYGVDHNDPPADVFACVIDESAGQHDKALLDITEKQWQAQVKELASMLGYRRAYHTYDSRRSQSGFPDLVLVRDRVIYLELKRETGKLSETQRDWLTALLKAGAEAYVARPRDLEDLATVLGRRATPFRSALADRTRLELAIPP